MLGGELYHGGCLEIMPRIPRESVDLVLCDLPYGTTASTWDKIIPIDKLWAEYTRILKPRGTVALFCVQPFTSQLVMHGLKGKLHYRYMWVWLKSNKTNFGAAHIQPLRIYEEIAVFGKCSGKYYPQNTKKLDEPILWQPRTGSVYRKNKSASLQTVTNYPVNALSFKSKNSNTRYHPNEKPEALLRYLIRTYTDAGDMVLDNTMGSGSTCVAAAIEGRRYIGIERDDKYYDIACARVAEAERQVRIDTEAT